MKSISELVKLVNGLPWACTGASTYTNSPRNLRPTARKNPPAVWFLCLSDPDFCHRLKAWGSILADFSESCCCCLAGRPADPHWEAGGGSQQQMKKYAGQSELYLAANQTFPRHLMEYFSRRWNGGCEGELIISPPNFPPFSQRFIFHVPQSNLRLSWTLQLDSKFCHFLPKSIKLPSRGWL